MPEAFKIAIEERDGCCKVRGCDATEHLERHHVEAFAMHGLTSYELLGLLCPDHHDRITYDGYTIAAHDHDTWTLHPPDTAGEHRDADAV